MRYGVGVITAVALSRDPQAFVTRTQNSLRVPRRTFSFERRDVLHDRCLARETKMILDLSCAWRDPFFALFALNEIKDAFLACG